MSTAIEDLKLLLLQDEWTGKRESLFDALQLLVSVAEMKEKSVNDILFSNSESLTDVVFHDDFFVSNEKIVFSDSDDSNDEDNKTETFYTADENYDADEEYFSTYADETDSLQSSTQNYSFNTVSNFRNTNEHICKLVVEILMNISRQYFENKGQWDAELLISLMKRLSCMNKHLGGSELIVKGFSPLLKVKDDDIESLQKAILNLIGDLDTPNVLKACFSILTTNNAPVELIIARIEAICDQESIPKPFKAVQYPICLDTNEPVLTSTTNIDGCLQIKSFYEIHSDLKQATSFTQASQIIPLNTLNLQIWNSEGCTISTWIHLQPNTNNNCPHVHLLSIGTDKLILAVYINADGSFTFNVIKPSKKIYKHKYAHDNDSDSDDTFKDPNQSLTNKENNINETNIFGIASAIIKRRESRNIRTRGSFKKGFRKGDDNMQKMDTTKITTRSRRCFLGYSKWTHVCLSMHSTESQITVLLTLNGTEHESIEIPINDMMRADVNEKLQVLFVGAHVPTSDDHHKSIKYSMNNVLLFKTPLETYMIAYLFGLGPDCETFISCDIMKCMPIRGYLDLSKLIRVTSLNGNVYDLICKLQSLHVMSLSLGTSGFALGFPIPTNGIRMGLLTVGKIPKVGDIGSLARSVYFSGGLTTMLFLFARTIELTDDPETQSLALNIFFKTAYSNNYLYAEFEQKNLFSLVAHVFRHTSCYRGPGMLKAVLDVIYGGKMFHRKSKADPYEIDENSELNIRNPSLLIKLLTHFSIFNTSEGMEAINLDLFFKSIMTTVKDTHPYKKANRQCLCDFKFFEKLIDFCKMHLGNTCDSMKIAPSTAHTLAGLFRIFGKNPLTMKNINEIHKLLLLIHHPSHSFITHDRSKISFLIYTQKPLKLSRTARGKFLNFRTKIISSVATAEPSSLVLTEKNKKRIFEELKSGEVINIFRVLGRKKQRFNFLTSKKLKKKRLQLKRMKKLQRKHKNLQFNMIRYFKVRSKDFHHLIEKKTAENTEEVDRDLIMEVKKAFSSNLPKIVIISKPNDVLFESGINIFQEQLLIMVKDAITELNIVPEDIKIEHLVMFANHKDANVRAAVINLIRVIVSRQSTELVNSYTKLHSWIHIGNLLSISPAKLNMVQACVDWICGRKILLNEIPEMKKIELKSNEDAAQLEICYSSEMSPPIEIKFRPAIRVLISMLTAMTFDHQLLKYAINFLRIIMESSLENYQNLMDQGLVTVLLKCLMNINRKPVGDSIYEILEHVAVKALISAGSMPILWELFYGLEFAAQQTKSEKIKEIHLKLSRQLMSYCLTETNRRGSNAMDFTTMFTVVRKLGSLPSSEIKLRFNQLLDRTIQYILIWDKSKELKVVEIDFVKYLIDLYFCGIHQGLSLILWSLKPIGCEEIKQFTVHKLISNLIFDSTFSIPDSKIFKSLLHQYVSSNLPAFSDEQKKILTVYCGMSLNTPQQNWSWGRSATDKLKDLRNNAIDKQNEEIYKYIYRLEPLILSCIDFAMKMTRDVTSVQHLERRNLINELKKTQEIDHYREWYELIQRMTHENAPWYNEDLYPTTYELDETEGPSRMRIRLKRTTLRIEERFFNEEFKYKAKYQERKQLLDFLLNPKETVRYSIREQVLFSFTCKHLTMELEIEGEIIVTQSQVIFLSDHNIYHDSIISNITDIEEIWDRRYQHKEIAIEFFLNSKKTFFIIFDSNYDRDVVSKYLLTIVKRKINENVEAIAQKWMEQKLTNYEYLMELNKISGRSYNDLMQYPVFPWILSSFEGDNLNLTVAATFRNLFKTISTQFEEAEEHYKATYNYLMTNMNDPLSIMKPYHYSSHYSNSGTVLHFLVRLPPFTNMFLLYQDHNFDIPDRTFHSLATTLRLTSRESTTDVKELIPEFFFMPDFLINQEGFNYGRRQSGEQVNDVKLPEWSNCSARLFTMIHRQALESDFVRKNLNKWIDLIFGYKQKGKAAVDAINVFHPATYPEFQITSIMDLVERSAYETMVKTYGQMPKQVFTSAHKKSTVTILKNSNVRPVLKNVKGLKWGLYTGSPQLPSPKKIPVKTQIKVNNDSRLLLFQDIDVFVIVPQKGTIIQGSQPGNFELALWYQKDGIIKIKSLENSDTLKLISVPTCDRITACGANINYPHIWIGHGSGNISVYMKTAVRSSKIDKKSEVNEKMQAILEISVNRSVNSEVFMSKWMYPIVLLRHQAEIVAIKVSTEFNIAVSIGMDGRTVIWDAQKIEYIRTIDASCNTLRSQLTHVDVSPTLGDILTVFMPRNDETADMECFEMTENSGDDFINVSMAMTGRSQLRLHNINGIYIGHVFEHGIVAATCFSFIKEGTGVNVFAVAFSDGSLKMYSTWNLELVREIETGCQSMIRGIGFSAHQYLVILTDTNINLFGSDGLSAKQPLFHKLAVVK